MKTTTFLPTAHPAPRTDNSPAWQLEIKKLQVNHVAIELILRKPDSLSTEVLMQYYALREELIGTMEDFLSELDRTESIACSSAEMFTVLRAHAFLMNKLNTRVETLLRKQQSMRPMVN